MTPHIKAEKHEISKKVIMPGDPLRAKFIAEKFLKNIKQVNTIRNMFFYTGEYKGEQITIASSGMGIPSMGIYSYELYKFYDVEKIIRVGSCGTYTKDLNLYDIYNIKQSFTESAYPITAGGFETSTTGSTENLFNEVEITAKKLGIKLHSGNAHCSEVFYGKDPKFTFAKTHNLDVVEMESTALFANAKILNKEAACLLTISDSLIEKNQSTTPEEREKNFMQMVEIALETLTKK
ncbi:purine-nucleoside phosphorylase [Spiroplasma endosymbiont of Crioceris asparagi]|uniref:purine-nucleoside phosphorylase n=1 Tax=Spiroplasma endosymbiont of Crioceris asparagi TaxID=3066286 RepID=UPI0030CB51AE